MIHGVINIYKEQGFTSHDVVAKLRGILGQKKIGHTGTLDPDATGVLPVCLGKATKLCDLLTDKNKTYKAVMLLGVTTDTQDRTGIVLEKKDISKLSPEKVFDCIQQFVGEYNQIPPMYSALKVNGKKLYELARDGIEIERKSRRVHIYQIVVTDITLPRVSMEIICSKGTYIRTLCQDIGDTLFCGACMESLARTKVSRFDISDSLTLSEVEQKKTCNTLDDYIIPIDEMLGMHKRIDVLKTGDSLLINGNPFSETEVADLVPMDDLEEVRVYSSKKQFVAIYYYQEDRKRFKLKKMFFDYLEQT